MAHGIGPDDERQQDEVLSKVDALLRRHRSGGLDAVLDGTVDAEIPTLTEIIEEPSPTPREEEPPDDSRAEVLAGESAPSASPANSNVDADAAVADRDDVRAVRSEPAHTPEEILTEQLRAEIERAIGEALAKQLTQAIHDQVMPELMLHLGEGLNRLRDAMRNTVRGVVEETIAQEVRRTLKSMIKEREQR